MMIDRTDCTPRASRRLKRRAEIERVWHLVAGRSNRPLDFDQFLLAADDLMEVERSQVLDDSERQLCKGCKCCPR